ncbi:hypothetical protein ACIZ62_12075 [Acetobacterium carbinolicum]|uniref:hypothetical protein n=1 Tax=Acetobacterium carbinolicum TaxID=52690 RepID=UPI0039BFF173
MNELHKKLLNMKNLVTDLNQYNQKENNYKAQMQPKINSDIYAAKKVTKKYFAIIAMVAVIFILLSIPTFIGDIQRAYKNDSVDDEFQWALHHPGDEYPGYEKDPSVVTTIFMSDFGPIILIAVIIAGGYITIIKVMNTSKKKVVNENNIKIVEQNKDNELKNTKLYNEVAILNQEREKLYIEITRNLQEWFPKDYCFLNAIDYFINLVENHMADTIQKAVELYLDDMRHRITSQKLDQIKGGMLVMINNQQVMMSKQDEMIRQQIIGNCINSANLANNMAMRRDIKDVGDSAERAAKAASNAAYAASGVATK